MEPIKVKHIGGTPHLHSMLGDEGYRVSQWDWKTFCKLEGPIGDKISAVTAWNTLALKLNGDDK